MATSALQVLNYQQTITSTNSEFHLLGLLLDPLNKDQFERCSNQIDFPEVFISAHNNFKNNDFRRLAFSAAKSKP
jgi:hypothetical protein